ncbi:sushi domain-containing protein 6-like isoform X1 [Acipenser ruthenus]|uniref:sushi domain-containing protein 6-like isoform X1 n=1 Tax=Acipenser ruthenus TaxID=7906 RepID=UPI0027424D35|nr:sushi domain-containing protein 6-like isoform X1 [Acipenser ruthenus]XP_033881896.2 sushi domain-containing protein 6-like isoform X1 [Acipenser ruthenus]
MPAHPMTSVTGCLGSLLCCGSIVLLLLCDDAMGAEANSTAGQPCSHPLVPEHGGFRCAPSPCRGFAPKRVIEYFCEPGYSLHGAARTAHCRHGKWSPTGPPYCAPDLESNPGSGDSDTTDQESSPLPAVATTAVAVSVFLLTTTACILVKPRVRVCHCDSRRLSDQLGLMIDSPPVLLPSYEEAVYGNQGNLAPPTRGPTQLLCVEGRLDPAHQPPDSLLGGLSNCCVETLPPPYEEVQSHSSRNEQRRAEFSQTFRVSTAIGKDV